MPPLDIVFTKFPGHDAPRFVEVEIDGKSVSIGEWVERPDGYVALRFTKQALEVIS